MPFFGWRAHPPLTRPPAPPLPLSAQAYRRAPPPGADAAQVSPEPPSAPPDPGDLHALTGQHQTEQERAREARAAEAAEAAFAPLFEGDGLVQTLIERFLVPTREELDEWECDPAALLASREPAVAPGGEADSPRPCAELLLTCLLLRKPPAVSAAVLRAAEEARALLSQPAASPAESAARVLVLDGAYRAIGVLSHELPKASVSFPQWFTGELRPMLDAHAARAAGGLPPPGTPAWAAALPERLLCARGLWLIGRFCDDVAEDPKALELVVPVVLQHLVRAACAAPCPPELSPRYSSDAGWSRVAPPGRGRPAAPCRCVDVRASVRLCRRAPRTRCLRSRPPAPSASSACASTASPGASAPSASPPGGWTPSAAASPSSRPSASPRA